MDKRLSKRPKKEHDFAVTAFRVIQEAVGETEVEPSEPEPTSEERHNAAVILGRKGGKKGGKARAANLSPERRSEIAKKVAAARWLS